MPRGPLVLAATVLLACRMSGAGQDNDDLKRRIEELSREVARLRAELVRARTENLDLKLRAARAAKNFDEELKLLLNDGLGSEFTEIQQHALKELLNLPPERRKAAVPPILERWRTADDRFCVAAIRFLYASGDPAAVRTVLDSATHPSPDVRREVAAVLANSTDDKSREVLEGMLKDPQTEVRAAAVDALANLKREASVRPILEFLRLEKAPELLEKAVLALGEIRSREAVPTLIELLAENVSLRWACISSLGKIGDARAIPALRPFLEAGQPANIRNKTINSLGKLKDAASLPAIEKILAEETDAGLRGVAAEAVGRIGEKASVERALLPAYASEKEEKVRKEIWAAVLVLSDKDLELLERVTDWLIAKGLKEQIESVARRLADWTGENGNARIAAILEKICEFTYAAKEWLRSLEHHKALLKYAPQNWKAHLRMAKCYLEAGDAESAVRTINEAAEKARGDAPTYWTIKADLIAALQKLNDPARTVEETYAVLFGGEAAPEELRKAMKSEYDDASARIVEQLRSVDEAVRKKAVDIARRLAKRIIRPLAAALEAAAAPGLLEAGNAIAGTTYDTATTDAAKLKEIAAAWRAWADKP